MNPDEGIDALSEKEREALRLLLAGHDAKSSAQELGVSHHAIHDRLRRARQKLGTTGSRQAALLLSEAEKGPPKSFVHELAGGEVTAHSPEDPSSADLKRPVPFWSQRRSKGLIIMSLSILIAAAAIALNTHGESLRKNAEAIEDPTLGSKAVITKPTPTANLGHPAEKIPAGRAKSEAAARKFMDLIDAGEADASYEAAAPTFRKVQGFDLWELGVALRGSEGGAQRRTLVEVERDGNPSNPVHEALEILIFDTIMLNGERKTERLVMALIDGTWQVAKIDIVDVDEH